MNVGIYSIINLINGKQYIGQTTDLNKRKHDHFRNLKSNRHHNPHLQHAFNEYGEDNFEFFIITTCSEEELNDLEQYYIEYFNTMDREFGYNLDSGGVLNRKLSDESIGKMSKSLSNNYNNVGFYRVYKQNKKDAVQGFQWCYRTYSKNRRIQIRSIDLMEVKEKVISRGLDWFVTDEKLANKSLEENKQNLLKNKKGTNSGFYRVHYSEYSSNFHYQCVEKNKKFHRARTNLDDLKKEVLANGFEWKILDEEKARKSLEISENNIKQKRISEGNKKINQSGFFRVYRSKCPTCKKKFMWAYLLEDYSTIQSVDLFNLKEKVLERGLEWKVTDGKKAKISIEINNQEVPEKEKIKPTNTGFYKVQRVKCDSKKGFIWVYKSHEKQFASDNLNDLKDEILSNGLEWRILDKEKALISWNRDKGIIPHRAMTKRNTTGLLRVIRKTCEGCINGYIWTYSYGNKSLNSVDLIELKKRVLDKNWEWKILDEEKAKKSFEINKPKTLRTTNTGFYRVSQVKRKNCKQGFTWRYYDKKQFQSTNLLTLRNKVISEGLDWIIEDEKLAQKSVKLNNYFNSTVDDFDKFCSVKNMGQLEYTSKHPQSEIISVIKKDGTGFLNVYISERKSFSNGIQWKYYSKDKLFTSADLLVLKDKVLANDLEWKIVDEKKAKRSLELNKPKTIKKTNSGFYKVSKTKRKNCKQGFIWAYFGKRTIRSINLFDLKNKVVNEGLKWAVEDVKKAKNSVELNNKLFDLNYSLEEYS